MKDVGVDSLDRPIREMFNQVVKASLPSQCANWRDEPVLSALGREGAIALVGQALAAARKCGRKVGPPVGDRA